MLHKLPKRATKGRISPPSTLVDKKANMNFCWACNCNWNVRIEWLNKLTSLCLDLPCWFTFPLSFQSY